MPFFLFLLGLFLRFPSFLTPFTSDDEAIYAAMASILRHGGALYRDAVDHKPPGTLWLYSGVFSLFGDYNMLAVHLLLIFWVFTTAWVLGKITEHFCQGGGRWAMLLYLLFSTTLRDYDALAANNELLMNLPIVLAAWWILRKRFFLAGSAMAIAITIKYQALFPSAAFLIFLFFASHHRGILRYLLAHLLVGFLTVGWIVYGSGWDDFYFWGIRFNLDYVSQGLSGGELFFRFIRRSLETLFPALLVWGVGFWALRKNRNGFLALWFFSSLLSVFLGGRFFGHYFLQPLAPLAVLAALLLPSVWERGGRLKQYLILGGLVIPVVVFFNLAICRTQLLRIVGEREPDYASVGQRIQELTNPDDRIFVWTNSPQIYFYAKRVPGTRFTFCNYQSGQSPSTPAETDPSVDTTPYQVEHAWELLFKDLEQKRPFMIIDAAHAHFDDFGKSPMEKFPRLMGWVKEHYDLVETVKGVRLYHLKGAEKG